MFKFRSNMLGTVEIKNLQGELAEAIFTRTPPGAGAAGQGAGGFGRREWGLS